MLTRRQWLFAAPTAALAAGRGRAGSTAPPVRFGLIADIHQDVIPDAAARVAAFVDAMDRERVDFIAQLGDFCIPKPENRPVLDVFNRFPGDRLHVLGNHDMDGGFTREQAAEYLGMPAPHHAYEKGGIRFLVLDGNEPGGKQGGYKRFVGREQLDWLARELRAPKPAVVLIHQPIDHAEGVENGEEVRRILKDAGPGKILAVFAGHLHKDYAKEIDGIPYVQVNSASYFWMGEKFDHASYDPEAHLRKPSLRYTCPYRDPLWAVATIDRERGTLSVEGRSTGWVGRDPWELGATEKTHDPKVIRPAVSPRKFQVPASM